MKKILSMITLLLPVSLLAGGGIHFEEGKWNDLVAKAKKENKYIFLDSYTDWCYWCKVMDKQTFTDSTVYNYINSNFIATRREMEKEAEGVALSMKYHVNAFPTFLVFSPEGKLVYRIMGYKEPAAFLADLQKATAPGLTDPFPGIGPELDPGFPSFYKESFGTGKKRKWPALKTVTDYLDGQKDLTTEVCWSVMWRFPLNDKYENWILDNQNKLISLYGEEEVNYKIADILYARNGKAAETKNEEAFKANLLLVEKHLPSMKIDLQSTLTMEYYEKTGNWKGYADAVDHHISHAGYTNPSFINSAAWTLYEKCDDKSIVKRAVVWMDSVCTGNEEYAYVDTYAALLYKDGQYALAEEKALLAIRLGKSAGEDVKSTEDLLANIRLKMK